MRFSAVLLAGGKSSRMGRDKALLEVAGQPLWRQQLETLRRLSPDALFLSGAPHPEWRQAGYDIIEDEVAGAGPLAGVAAALRRCTTSHLVVLAVDLPNMTTGFLRSLLASCAVEQGVVPRRSRYFEPLAAVYPVRCAGLAEAALRNGDFSMQRFVRAAANEQWIVGRNVSVGEAPLFRNLNTPADL